MKVKDNSVQISIQLVRRYWIDVKPHVRKVKLLSIILLKYL